MLSSSMEKLNLFYCRIYKLYSLSLLLLPPPLSLK